MLLSDELKSAVIRLAEAAPKLFHETGRLHRDVSKLSAKVFRDSEVDYTYRDSPYNKPPKKTWAVPDALNLIDASRRHIENCERELSAIRAKLDDILQNEASRDEFRTYLKTR